MESIRELLLILLAVILLVQNLSNVEARYHHHKKQKNKGSTVPPPAPPENPVSSSPSYSPSVPSDPYPNDPVNSTDCIFDVRDYGAVGDGSADDTAAFRAAWKAACAVEAGVVLAPSDYVFKITSTIFSGPCKPGLVFQVSIYTKKSPLFQLISVESCWIFQPNNYILLYDH